MRNKEQNKDCQFILRNIFCGRESLMHVQMTTLQSLQLTVTFELNELL